MESQGTNHSIAKVPRRVKVVTELVTTVRRVDTFPAIVPRKRSLTTEVKAATRMTEVTPEEGIREEIREVIEPVITVKRVGISPETVLRKENHDKRVVTRVMVATEVKVATRTTEVTPEEDTREEIREVIEPVTIVRRVGISHETVLRKESQDRKVVTRVTVATEMKVATRTTEVTPEEGIRTVTEVRERKKGVSSAVNRDIFPKNALRKFNASSASKRVTSLMSARVTNF